MNEHRGRNGGSEKGRKTLREKETETDRDRDRGRELESERVRE